MKEISLNKGVVLHGVSYNYTIEHVLGHGTFGITYLAKVQMKGALGSLDANVDVAIKEFFMQDFNGRDECSVTYSSKDGVFAYYKSKFIHEAENLSRLDNPGIIKVIELFEENQTAYYVMEYLPKGSLDNKIAKNGRITENEALRIARQIASAISRMHEYKMLHLDLKPGNILMNEEDEAVLIDFGLSKKYGENGKPETSTTVGKGTPGYAPIEQASFQDGKDFPVTMDIYALGATLYKMLTGKRPPLASDILNNGFPAYELQEAGVSNKSIALIGKAMRPIKAERIQTVEEFINGCMPDRDPQKSTELFDKAMSEGADINLLKESFKADYMNAEAAFEIANALEDGRSINKDVAAAAEWYLTAAKLGHTQAQSDVGEIYTQGDYVPVNYHIALKWLREAAANGFYSSQKILGDMYYDGRGVPQDYVEAARWYKEAAEQSDENTPAIYAIGYMYIEGLGVPQDYEVARYWFEKVAFQYEDKAETTKTPTLEAAIMIPDCMFYLGWIYHEGLGVNLDYAKALYWFKKAACYNHAVALFNVSTIYSQGEGVSIDHREALIWLKRAADKNMPNALFNLGVYNEMGYGGIPIDFETAMDFYQRAASAGSTSALNAIDNLNAKIASSKSEKTSFSVDLNHSSPTKVNNKIILRRNNQWKQKNYLLGRFFVVRLRTIVKNIFNHNKKYSKQYHMKKIHSLLALGILGATLSAMPQKSKATTVNVVSNSSSGIANANLTTTLNDGTILGFYRSGATIYLCGAISQQEELAIPDSISYSSNNYAVNYIGYNRCDFDNAQNVSSLILPATITGIRYLPATVKVLHANSYVSSVTSTQLSNLNKILVPESTLASYYGNTNWSNYVLINTEGTEPLEITINMTKAGEFAQLLLQQTDDWYKVNELTVVGDLSTDDLNVFKRMKQLTKLDLSQATIADIPDNFDGASNTNNSRYGFNILEELILPEVNNIGKYAFAGCYRLKSVTMPKVNSLGYGAFSRLGANQITLPEGITSIGDYAFCYSNLESITIPSSMTKISDYCFYECIGLKSASIPFSVVEIGSYAFGLTGLTSIKLPGVKTIRGAAFYNCIKLAEVIFAKGLTSLESSPFFGCTALTEIDLPSTLLSMTNSAFYGCTNIKKVTSRAVVPPTHNNSSNILYGCDKTDVKLYVPAMSIDEYRAESGWKEFYTILPLEDKTSYAYIYDYSTIDDATEFTDTLDMKIGWCYQNRNGSNQYYCGVLDYNGNSTLSMHDYKQYHYLGLSDISNQYSYASHFTSLISNGSMRSDNVKTTLKVYNTYTWYFISLPYDVKVSDITYTDNTQFAIRKYSGSNRAMQSGNTWVDLTAEDTMNAYEGYILRCNKKNANFTFPAINNTNKNNVFEKESVEMPLGEYLSEFEHSRSWNLIGNPYPCYYDTRYMNFTAPITVWNADYECYDAYSPVDDSYILHPAQAFFVQRPVDQASITFNKAGRQKDATAQNIQANAKRRTAAYSHRKIFNILMSNGTVEDHTRLVVNSKASLAYELDKDASKFIADDNAAMLVYTVEDGVKYAINERPMAEGVVSLGFYANEDGDYSLSLNTKEEDNIILIDHETKTETALSGEYHFTAKAGYNDSRFTIMFGEATGINTINVDNGTISANSPYAVYTIDGRLVGSYNAISTANLPKGIYVISSKNVKRKIVVK